MISVVDDFAIERRAGARRVVGLHTLLYISTTFFILRNVLRVLRTAAFVTTGPSLRKRLVKIKKIRSGEKLMRGYVPKLFSI